MVEEAGIEGLCVYVSTSKWSLKETWLSSQFAHPFYAKFLPSPLPSCVMRVLFVVHAPFVNATGCSVLYLSAFALYGLVIVWTPLTLSSLRMHRSHSTTPLDWKCKVLKFKGTYLHMSPERAAVLAQRKSSINKKCFGIPSPLLKHLLRRVINELSASLPITTSEPFSSNSRIWDMWIPWLQLFHASLIGFLHVQALL